MNNNFDKYMKIAIMEAEQSLREGNHGFGAVIVKGNDIISQTHDTDVTDSDPTAHAELKAIRTASSVTGKDLSGSILISTHEPCPMCAGAIVWSKIKRVIYGYGISDAIAEGRERIAITCDEIFSRAGADIEVHKGVLKEETSVLYNRLVREEIKKLRNAGDDLLEKYNEEATGRRIEWYKKNSGKILYNEGDLLEKAYRLLLAKLNIRDIDTPVIKREKDMIMFHSQNFCPTLEACKILNLDTRKICRLYNERATDGLIKQIDSGLCFTRNYEKLRPYTPYCEEMIIVSKKCHSTDLG
ncbi:MAG: nucleoside deaminase [Candidatus Eremiobacterota bacterium]